MWIPFFLKKNGYFFQINCPFNHWYCWAVVYRDSQQSHDPAMNPAMMLVAWWWQHAPTCHQYFQLKNRMSKKQHQMFGFCKWLSHIAQRQDLIDNPSLWRVLVLKSLHWMKILPEYATWWSCAQLFAVILVLVRDYWFGLISGAQQCYYHYVNCLADVVMQSEICVLMKPKTKQI